MKPFIAAALLGISLAACGGGGGGGSTLPPPTNGGSKATLGAGFANTSNASGQSRRHLSLRANARVKQDPVLGGSIVPFAIFAVPDSYVPKFMPSILGYEAVAFLTPQNGASLPSPLPTPTFSQSGDPLVFVGQATGAVPGIPGNATIIGGESVLGPSAPGQTTVTASAIGQTVNITADSYAGLGISAQNGGQQAPSGLSFTSSGAVVDTATFDLAIDDASSPSAFVAPNGIVEVNKPIDQVSTNDFGSVLPVTHLALSDICATPAPQHTFILKTKAGLFVKFQIWELFGTNLDPSVCAWTDVYAPYQVSGSNGFAF